MTGARGAVLVLAVVLGLASDAAATTLLPISDGELRARSRVVVEGVVLRVEARRNRRGVPETETTIRVERVFKGARRETLLVRDRGGELPDGSGLEIFGRPDYVVGRRVVVFAIPHPEGDWQTAEFTLGKFEIWRDRSGRRYLARDLLTRSMEGVRYLESPDSPAPATERLRDYDAFVRMLRSPGGEEIETSADAASGLQPEESLPAGARPQWAQWSSTTLYRWSNGATASWVLSSTPSLIPGGGYAEARAALSEWTNHPASTINYGDGGVGPSGANFIELAAQDTCGALGPFCGSGVIGCGGPSWSGTHVWRDETYRTIVGGHVEIRALTAGGCVSSGVFAATVTHELGHTLGFGHSNSGVTSSHDVCEGDENAAQMRSSVQSRGTALGTDDSDAARWVYGDGGSYCTDSPGPTGASFYSVPPCRLVDTRRPVQPLGGPALQAGTARTFLLGGACGLPSTARAVSVNLTVTSASSAGNLRIDAGGQPVPLASAINFRAGAARANNAIVALGPGGSVTVFCEIPSGTADFILDLAGYFE